MLENLQINDTIKILKYTKPFTIIDSKIISDIDNILRLFLIQTGYFGEIWLCEKTDLWGEQSDIRLYTPASQEFKQGDNRRAAMNNGGRFLFDLQDKTNFRYCDLDFTKEIKNNDVIHLQESVSLYGSVLHNGHDISCGITEYISNDDIEQSRLLLLEMNNLDKNGKFKEDGGELYLFEGYSLKDIDINIQMAV